MEEADIYLGVDLGGTEIKAVTLTLDGRSLWSKRVATHAQEGKDAVLGRIVELVGCAVHEARPARIRGTGLAAPAVLDMAIGRVEKVANLTPDWNGFPLKDELEARTTLPCCLLNDVRAATVAEHARGVGRAHRDFVFLAIGTGIGGGLVLNGELYLGSRGAAGELGHQTVVPNGSMCGCGNTGCLETVASGPAIAREALAAIQAGDRELAVLAGSEQPLSHEVAHAALAGSSGARAIFARAGTLIGLVLSNLVCALNPEAVVIGGGVAEAGDLLLQPIRDEIEKRTIVFSQARGGVEVLQSSLGSSAGALGAAVWAMSR